MDKIYSAIGALVLLTCCSTEHDNDPERLVIASPPPSTYPVTTSTATILKKRALPHSRMEYHARLATGQEMSFTTDVLPHYQVGDVITLPRE